MELAALQTGGKIRLKWVKRTRYDWSNKYAELIGTFICEDLLLARPIAEMNEQARQ